MTVRCLNDSSKDILKAFYDDKAPLGFCLSAGKIIKSELIGASNDYLTKNVVLDVPKETAQNLSKPPQSVVSPNEIKFVTLGPDGQLHPSPVPGNGLVFQQLPGSVVGSEPPAPPKEDLAQQAISSSLKERSILFPNLIVDAGQSFTLKLLVLHPQKAVPILKPLGKIAGIQSIPVHEVYKEQERESSLKMAFRGTILVHFLRVITYGLGTIFGLGFSIGIAVTIREKLAQRSRSKLVREFTDESGQPLGVPDRYILSQFRKSGVGSLVSHAMFLQELDRKPYTADDNDMPIGPLSFFVEDSLMRAKKS